MNLEEIKELVSCLRIMPDPRRDHGKKHELVDIILIILLGVIAKCDDLEEVESWAEEREDWLKTFLDLPNGIPSHDTLNRVVGLLDPRALQDCFSSWLNRTSTEGKVVSVDGKTLRRSYDKGKEQEPLHLVNVWNADDHIILGQEAVNTKSNEIIAIPIVLDRVDITGAIVTIDAMGCQRNIAAKIRDKGADYLLALKGNQPTLEQDVIELLQEHRQAGTCDFYETVEKDHGRIETRRCFVTGNIFMLGAEKDWKDIRSVAMIESIREINGRETTETRYFISSCPPVASQIATAARKHWGIENTLHWSLDVSFNEDRSRLRQQVAAQNFSFIKKFVISLLKNEHTSKISLKLKRLKACHNDNFLLNVLFSNVNKEIQRFPRKK